MMRNVKARFEDVSNLSGAAFETSRAARGAAFGDFDNDGFVDVAVNINDGQPLLLHNRGGEGNWVLITTVGSLSNRDGIGARVRVVGESGLTQYRVVSTAASYLSASDKRVHFGLGKDRALKMIEITWPSGIVQRLEDVEANQILDCGRTG